MKDHRLDADDADAFLDDLNTEEQTHAGDEPLVFDSLEPAPTAPSNFVPIHEFLKRKSRRKKWSLRDVALAAYEKQRKFR